MSTMGGATTRGQGSMAQGMWGRPPQTPYQATGVKGAPIPGMTVSGSPSRPPDVTSPRRVMTPSGWQDIPEPDATTQPVTHPGGPPALPAPITPTQPAAPTSTAQPARGQAPVPPGTMDPYTGKSPVNPDGSFISQDGGVDWLPGYGPQYDWGGMDIPTGLAPISPRPPEGTRPRDMDLWIQANLRAGRTLADLGLQPVKAGGLSAYMRYGGGVGKAMQGTGGGESTRPPVSSGPEGVRTAPETGGTDIGGGGPNQGGAPPPTMSYGQASSGSASFNNALMDLIMSLYGGGR